MSLPRDESTAMAKPDCSDMIDRIRYPFNPLRFPVSSCEPGYLDRHPLPMPPARPDCELIRKRRICQSLANKTLWSIMPKSKELYKNLSSSIDMGLRCDESTVLAKPDGGKASPSSQVSYPMIPCEPGHLDLHYSLLNQLKRRSSIGELIPKRRIIQGDSLGAEYLPKKKIRLRDTPNGPEGGCWICSLDEHPSKLCPYRISHIPKNAIVGRGCDIVCKVCNALFSGRCCNQDLGCARLKFCYWCLKYGKHWSEECLDMKPDSATNAGEFVIKALST